MRVLPCPSCKWTPPKLLSDLSQDARVNYYRCPECGHVWTTDKNDTVILRHVTTLAMTVHARVH